MKELITAVAVALSVALAILAAAVYGTGLQAPQIAAPGEGGPVRNPWLLGYDDDDEDEGDSDGN